MPPLRPLLRTLLQPLAIAVGLALLARAAVQFYAIPSESMAPTLLAGDRIVVTRYLSDAPERGHVVVFTSPADGRELLVKRVVAVPGDLVDSRFGRLRVGGHVVPETYARDAASTGEIAPFVVPAASYFVLGDHRRDSVDSRTWGVVPRTAITGRARLVLWSSAEASSRVAFASGGPDAEARAARRGGRIFKWIE
jgi:signal peptidase I